MVTLEFLHTLNALLEHIKEVELDAVQIGNDAVREMIKSCEEQGVKLEGNAIKALQTQDVIAQQLTATVETIALLQEEIGRFEEGAAEESEQLQLQIKRLLSEAKVRQQSYSGKFGSEEDADAIEFF